MDTLPNTELAQNPKPIFHPTGQSIRLLYFCQNRKRSNSLAKNIFILVEGSTGCKIFLVQLTLIVERTMYRPVRISYYLTFKENFHVLNLRRDVFDFGDANTSQFTPFLNITR